MSGWRPALWAFFAWAVHFFVAYGLMLAFPEARSVGSLTIGLGLACLAFLVWTACSHPKNGMIMVAAMLSAIAIAWQSIVGLF